MLLARRRWSKEEVDFLNQNYGKIKTSKIAQKLRRKPSLYQVNGRRAEELIQTLSNVGVPKLERKWN